MKKGLLSLLLLISIAGFSQSTTTIPALPQKNNAALNDTIPVQNGHTYRYTIQQLYDLIAGNFLTTADLTSYEQSSHATATYATKTALNNYLLSSDAASTYLTSINSSQVTTALGFTPYNATNPSGYITSSALSPYETSSHASSTYQPIGSYLTTTTGDARYSLLAHTHTFASLTSKPTTIAGYGITDAYPLTGNPSGFLISSDIAGKQNTITLTNTGTSGAATFNATTGALNIPNYATGGSSTTDASLLTSGTLADARLSSNVSINLTPTAVKTTSYTAAANDFVKTDATSGTVPITLPTAPADKTRIAVKMIAVAGSNTTTITRGGTDVFNKAGGSTSIALSLLNQGLIFQYEAATGIWSVISGDIPLSSLDARFATVAQVNTNTSAIAALASPTNVSAKRDYNAKGDAILLTDAVVTAASTTVTSASASFVVGDVGKVVCIPYAGTGATVGQSHITTIASVTNGTTIVLTAAPTLSIVGARTVTDAGISLNGTTLTSATANFTQGDIGKKINIPGAGLTIANSGGAPQPCYITTIISATQVTVSRKALATVSAQTVTIPGAILIYGSDDTSPLQSAITAAASAKKPLTIEPGRYLITASEVPVSYTKIVGYGAGATTIYPCGTGGFAAFQNITGTVAAPLVDIQIQDLEIDGIGNTGSSYTTATKGLYMRPMIRPVFRNLYVHNTAATGIGCDWLIDGQIMNNTVEHCGRQITELSSSGGGAGIGIGTGTWTEEPTIIAGNNVFDNGNYGIFIESQSSNVLSRGIRIVGNDVRWNTNGIGDHATEGTIIANNTSEYNFVGIDGSTGFVAGLYPTNGIITGNVVRNNFSSNINILYKNGSYTITNNEITGGGTGIQCTMTSGGTLQTLAIKNNIIHESTGTARGIYFPSGTWNVVEIDNNTIYNINNSTGTPRPAINMTVTSCNRLYVTGNKAYDTRASGSKTQSHGLVITGTVTRFVYDRNDFADNATAKDDLTGATITTTATPSTNY